jgi:hypothetical protein
VLQKHLSLQSFAADLDLRYIPIACHIKRMGTFDTSSLINSVWAGRFEYDRAGRGGVAFSAWLTIADGRISGSMLEPNTLVGADGEELEAQLRGHVDDQLVEFLKTYRDLDQEPVYCEGKIAEQGRKIVGKWYHGWPEEVSGTFELHRQSAKAASQPRATGKTWL